jgi:O-antigen/teichoic acid export membrane protein
MLLNFKKILSTGFNSLIIRGFSVLLSFLLAWILVRVLGTENYGIFTYAFSWLFFIGSLSPMGLSSVLVRETGRYIKSGRLDFAAGLISFSQRVNFLVSLFLAVLFAAVVFFFVPEDEERLRTALLIVSVGIPVFGQLFISKSVLNAVKKIELSLIPEQILRAAFALFVLAGLWFLLKENIRLNTAVWVNVGAFFFALLVSLWFVKKHLASIIRHQKSYARKKWLTLGFSFFMLSVISIINTRADILMLGLFGFTEQTGIYNISSKLAQTIGIPMMLSNIILAPYISEFFKEDKQELVRMIKHIIRIIFAIGVVFFTIFVFWGEDILHVFDADFAVGYFALIMLGSGQLLNIFTGPVGNILSMTKFEKLTLQGTAGSAVLNIGLNVWLIPLYDINGAAVATFASLVFWNIYLFILTWKKLKINASVI